RAPTRGLTAARRLRMLDPPALPGRRVELAARPDALRHRPAALVPGLLDAASARGGAAALGDPGGLAPATGRPAPGGRGLLPGHLRAAGRTDARGDRRSAVGGGAERLVGGRAHRSGQ